ncbi:MAG: transglutaminase-like domain-containing protein [Pseudomonadota bacterium]
MKHFLLSALAALVLLWHPASHAGSETRWMKVLLDGRKVGHLESTRQVAGDRVTSTERLSMVLDRAGVSLPVTTEDRSIETVDGRPLGFMTRTSLSGLESTVEGRVDDDGQVALVLRSGTSEQRRGIRWPAGAVLAEGARLAEQRQGLREGTRYEVLSFQPSNLSALPVQVEVGARERIAVDGLARRLTRIDQVADLQGTPLRMSAWVDADHVVLRATMPLLGTTFEMVACSKACATAPNQPTDILDRSMVAAPRALAADERAAGLAYVLRIRGEDAAPVPSLAEQRAERDDARWHVDVRPGDAARGGDDPPVADDTAATRWLNHDEASVSALAREAAGEAPPSDRAELMRRLERFVRGYIDNKSMRVGYASAAETVASREGDCTEHAVLLAALARALGVPARVVNGLAYAPAFAGRENVFVPHAWIKAWDGRRWVSYDAALPGFDAGHIALSVGDGDAAGFYAGVSVLGNLEVLSAEALPAPAPAHGDTP